LPQESASITSAPAASASLTPQVSCILDCPQGDVTCQAACQGIARPNSSQAAETNECAAKCDQGDGSPSDTQAYAKCQADCFASLFPSTQTNFPGAAGGAASAATSAAGSAASSAASSGRSAADSATSSGASGSPTGTPTGTATDASPSGGAANANSVKIAGAGLAGLMAIFAL
jgi:hypothetical protein